ncbi:hypothetical protein [Thalassospira marina]|uniref:Uncharacterized protein n=1 Tax=Thalassospira marina TaxID=2048283 RepID=A0ABM6QGH6_9PROT|nr:hypothetical protein [Thalassospira marina]AUG55704.1 hypothetical protein CSC3H3_22925 [Thalassospira marina]
MRVKTIHFASQGRTEPFPYGDIAIGKTNPVQLTLATFAPVIGMAITMAFLLQSTSWISIIYGENNNYL